MTCLFCAGEILTGCVPTSRRAFVQAAGTALLATTQVAGLLALMTQQGIGDELREEPRHEPPETPPGPRPVKLIENVWIPMSDGTRIAARIALPDDAEQNPVPAIIEVDPYRRRPNQVLASFGYASVMPDPRGQGNSEGRPGDEYVKQEQDDAIEVLAWIAKQPWCTGKLGLQGSSYSGFTALQIAARRPSGLEAIITRNSADDRYTDDAHYIGGCIVQDMFMWGFLWLPIVAIPPDPAVVGDRRRQLWLQRLNAIDFFVGNWLTHQHRDAFWKHGSVNEDYSAIRCAVYAVGGWVDGYNNAVARLLTGLKGPRKGLIGPWTHATFSTPRPAIDWQSEELRWWDHWLKGMDTGIMKEPMFRVFMQDSAITRGGHEATGRWVAEETWPSPRIMTRKFYLTQNGIASRRSKEIARTLKTPQTVGMTSPNWIAFNLDTEAPTDQALDDSRSMTFDGAPLSADIETMGTPVVTLDLSVDKPVAFLAIRLNEVTPDGASSRITYQILNLTHRDSHEFPTPLEPGKRYRIRIPLRGQAYVFKKDHRLRLALSTTYWPLIWPSPEAVTLTVYTGNSELELPVRPPRAADAQLQAFGKPPATGGEGAGGSQPGVQTADRVATSGAGGGAGRGNPNSALPRGFEWDVAAKKLTIRSQPDALRLIAGIEESEILDDDPTSARLDISGNGFVGDGVNIRTRLTVSLTKNDFVMRSEITVLDNGTEIASRAWDRKIARQLL